MKIPFVLLWCLGLLALGQRSFGAEQRCLFHTIVPSPQLLSAARSTTTVIELKSHRLAVEWFNGNPARAAWEGPIRVDRTAAKSGCAIPSGLISNVSVDASEEIVLLDKYSGSESWTSMYRLRDCYLLHDRMDAFWDETSSRFQRRPYCYENECYPARRYDLGKDCVPTLNVAESDRWTRQVYGVLIEGKSIKVKSDSPLLKRAKDYENSLLQNASKPD